MPDVAEQETDYFFHKCWGNNRGLALNAELNRPKMFWHFDSVIFSKSKTFSFIVPYADY